MSTTITSDLVMQGTNRGESSKKHKSWLPVIAPKDDASSSTSSNRSANNPGPHVATPVRTRLPPRSRTGCWTCRTRKVKCDEGRPVCGQCMRLGHNCDYNPRLSFRDDTPRIVERMQDITMAGSSVWDPTSSDRSDSGNSSVRADDTLPPFSSLATDEERERKAEAQLPGTFHVVVNPESFAHLPEYGDGVPESPRQSSAGRGPSIAPSLASSLGREQNQEAFAIGEDPNTVIISRFEDTTKRLLTNPKDSRNADSPSALARLTEPAGDGLDMPTSFTPTTTAATLVCANEMDTALLDHFRRRVWPQLAQLECSALAADRSPFLGIELVEQVAALSPPCYHALMALAASSRAHRTGGPRLEALQHYQEVVPALQNTLHSDRDLSSDGTFLTHFLLLLYEITAPEMGDSSLWSQQLAQLRRIALMRHEEPSDEPFPFIIWWICNIDLQALLSGLGSGEFIGTILANNIVPAPDRHLCPLGPDGTSSMDIVEESTLPVLLQANCEITMLAARLGMLARGMRKDDVDMAMAHGVTPPSQPMVTRLRQRSIFELQEALRRIWGSSVLENVRQSTDSLPIRSRNVLDHAHVLYRTCLIYSYTSMWSRQRVDTGPENDADLLTSIHEVLQVADSIVKESRLDLRYIVFPLFIAGVSAASGAEKMMASHLLMQLEIESIGTNTTATRHALHMVYERQNQRFMSVGHSLDVCWTDVISEQAHQVISFGF